MSAVAFPTAGLTMPVRRHLVAVPDLSAAPAAPVGAGAVATCPPQSLETGARRRSAHAVAAAGPVRLTDRGRAVLVALAFALAAVLGTGVGLALPAQDAAPEQVQSVTVGPGENLWTIAESVAVEGQDVRAVIDQIITLNNLTAATVHAGQELTVPAAG